MSEFEAELPSEAAAEPKPKSHWKSLAEELGAEVSPSSEKVQHPFAAPPAPVKARPQAEKPKPAKTLPDRRKWASIASELGLEVPELPPVEPEVLPSVAQLTGRAPLEELPPAVWSFREERSEVTQEVEIVHESTQLTLGPDPDLEMPNQADAVLEEVQEIEVFERRPAAWDVPASSEEIAYAEDISGEGESAEPRAEGAEGEEGEGQRRRRRRRRRRRGSGRGEGERTETESSPEASEDASLDDADGDEGEEETSAYGRRRERAATSAPREDADDEASDEPEGEATAGRRPRKFPTWAEAMDILVTKNMENHAKTRESGGGRRPRGGRGRGSRR